MPVYTIKNEYGRQLAADALSAVDPTLGWKMTLSKLKKQRTLDQNSLYHKWIDIIADEIGEGHEDTHDLMRRKFLPPVTKTVAGVTFEVLQSTARLETKPMAKYMDKVSAWAGSFLGVALPHPSDRQER